MSRISHISSAATPRSPSLSREEVAKLEIGRTQITRAQKWYLSLSFMLTIFLVPLPEIVKPWRQSASAPDFSQAPAYGLVTLIPETIAAFRQAEGPLASRVLRANRTALGRMQEFERRLEDESALFKGVLPPAQYVLTRLLDVGNEQAYVGRSGWLFYRPEIEYVTGPPFLSPRQLRARYLAAPAAAPVEADPRPAILDFHAQLAERGITLVLMPTPVKPTIHPEYFAAGYSSRPTQPLHNASYEEFVVGLQQRGVRVFDATEALLAVKQTGKPAYLAADTHWTPAAMDSVAQALARWLADERLLASSQPVTYQRRSRKIANSGDIAGMIELPPEADFFKAQRVMIREVTDEEGRLWAPARGADVLVLGDSFSNIFSAGPMGWGESAGFVEQLSFHLKRPLDQITQNDGGAHATRQTLSRALARGRDRLAGKKLVIWQFAARELAVGDWKRLDLNLREAPASSFLVAPTGGVLTAEGTIESISASPRPGSVPYKDHILCVHLVDVTTETPPGGDPAADGPPSATQAVVYMWGMRDNVVQSAANLRPGQPLKLRLRPWSDVADEYDAINRSELDDYALQLEEPNWGEPIE